MPACKYLQYFLSRKHKISACVLTLIFSHINKFCNDMIESE